jgi:uncharacterized membrane protein
VFSCTIDPLQQAIPQRSMILPTSVSIINVMFEGFCILKGLAKILFNALYMILIYCWCLHIYNAYHVLVEVKNANVMLKCKTCERSL